MKRVYPKFTDLQKSTYYKNKEKAFADSERHG